MLAQWLVFLLASWFLTYQSNRFLLPAAALGTVVAVAALWRTWRHARAAAWAGMACLLLVVAYNSLDSGRWLLFDAGQLRLARGGIQSRVRWPAYSLGFVSRDAYLRQHLNYYDSAHYCNENLGLGEKALLVGEHRKMHWRCAVEGSDWFDVERILPFLREARDADGLVDGLLAAGFTHLFLNLEEWGWPGPDGRQEGPAWSYNRRFLQDRNVMLIQALLDSPRLRTVHATLPGRIFVARLEAASPGDFRGK